VAGIIRQVLLLVVVVIELPMRLVAERIWPSPRTGVK